MENSVLTPQLDIVIPVYNEKDNIVPVLMQMQYYLKTPARILICYDFDEDNTLPAVRGFLASRPINFQIDFIKNKQPVKGVLGAIVTGFESSQAAAVLMYPADDDYNIKIIDQMYQKFRAGAEIVAASRFMPGGSMVGAPFLKGLCVRISSWVICHLAGLPIRDASNGFRLFSRRVITNIKIESKQGFAYSIELLVKCHRLGWPIAEVPALWFDRKMGQSRFRFFRWLPEYFRWFIYAFNTTYLIKK